jgi:uncharacterized protein VirK/YbjX
MNRLDLLKRSLYTICRYDYTDRDYVRYNQLLWANIQGLDEESITDAIKQLTDNDEGLKP